MPGSSEALSRGGMQLHRTSAQSGSGCMGHRGHRILTGRSKDASSWRACPTPVHVRPQAHGNNTSPPPTCPGLKAASRLQIRKKEGTTLSEGCVWAQRQEDSGPWARRTEATPQGSLTVRGRGVIHTAATVFPERVRSTHTMEKYCEVLKPLEGSGESRLTSNGGSLLPTCALVPGSLARGVLLGNLRGQGCIWTILGDAGDPGGKQRLTWLCPHPLSLSAALSILGLNYDWNKLTAFGKYSDSRSQGGSTCPSRSRMIPAACTAPWARPRAAVTGVP